MGYRPWGHKELDTTEQLHFLSRVQVHYSVCGYPVSPVLFVEKRLSSPNYIVLTLVENSTDTYEKVFWFFLGCLLRFPQCNSVANFEIKKYDSSSMFFFKNCFGFEGPLRFHMYFRMAFSISVEKHCWYFDRDYIEPALSSVANLTISSVQLLSHVRLCDPMDRSTPGLPVHRQLLEFTQTHVH